MKSKYFFIQLVFIGTKILGKYNSKTIQIKNEAKVSEIYAILTTMSSYLFGIKILE